MAQIFSIYLVYRDGRTLMHQDFQMKGADSDLVTGFLSAVSTFLSDLVGRISEEEKRLHMIGREDSRLRIIDREDIKILVEYGRNCYAAVFSTHDLPVIRQRMRTLLEIMEARHGEQLEKWNGNLSIFDDMIPLLDSLFRPFAVTERYVPVRLRGEPSEPLPQEVHSIFLAIDGRRTLEEIAEKLKLPLLQVMLGVQSLTQRGMARVTRQITIEQLVSPLPSREEAPRQPSSGGTP